MRWPSLRMMFSSVSPSMSRESYSSGRPDAGRPAQAEGQQRPVPLAALLPGRGAGPSVRLRHPHLSLFPKVLLGLLQRNEHSVTPSKSGSPGRYTTGTLANYLDSRITIQHSEVVTDTIGNHTNAWVDYWSCSAYANLATAKEYGAAGQTLGSDTLVFEVRWCERLRDLDSTKFRILFGGAIYNISSPDAHRGRPRRTEPPPC